MQIRLSLQLFKIFHQLTHHENGVGVGRRVEHYVANAEDGIKRQGEQQDSDGGKSDAGFFSSLILSVVMGADRADNGNGERLGRTHIVVVLSHSRMSSAKAA